MDFNGVKTLDSDQMIKLCYLASFGDMSSQITQNEKREKWNYLASMK